MVMMTNLAYFATNEEYPYWSDNKDDNEGGKDDEDDSENDKSVRLEVLPEEEALEES
jgi:hypothetical protein